MDENYQANNVLGLNDQFQSNNVTAIQNNLQNNNVINAPELNAKMQQAREEALSSNLAGEPYVPQLLTVPEKPIDLSDTQVTSGFTTRDQIMAKAGLMDDKGNYTDTYTNYISKGGSPLPGYEYAHQELLNQERYDRIFQKYQDGEMSYDTALMEAYGNDILAANFGIDLTSVAYWKNKFLSDDYSNPFANQYLMDQVKNIAQQYHTARQTGDWAHQNIADTQLSNLVGTEIDDLGYKKISDLFPNLQGLSKDLKEDDFLKALHTGQLDAQMRMNQADDGTWYYLHTDGKLYILDGKGGDGHGTLHTDAKGELESIDLNNNDIAIGLRGATSGFASVFTGIVDLGAMLLQSANELVPISAIFGDENLGIWDGVDDKDSIFSWANSFDSFMQDDYAWLVDDGYVDLSGNISGRDVWNFVGTFTGQIAGTMTLSWGMDQVAKGAQALNAAGHPILGKTLQGVSTGLKWQTGNIGSYSDAALKGSAAIWGRRLGAAGVANAKNFLNDTRKLTLQASLYEDGASNSEILMRTFQTSFLNFVIDSAISGGMDDNQVQAYEAFFTRNQKVVKDELKQRVTNSAFKKFLTNKSMVIGINSFGDLMGNLITGGVSSMNSIDNKTGKLADWDWASIGKATFSLENVERSVINTLWYSTRSQIKDWNAGLDSIGAAHDNILNKLEEEIRNNRKNPANQETLTKVRDNYLQTIKDSKAQTYEGQILEGMNKLCDELGEKGVPNLIKESFKPAVNERMVARAQELYDIAMISYDKLQTKISNAADPTNRESVGLFKKIVHPIQTLKNGKGVGKTVGKWLTGQSGAEANFREEEQKTTKFNATLAELSKVIISEQELDDIQANWDIVGDKKGALETSSAYQIKKKNKETYNQLCKVLGKEVVDNGMFYYIPQEASNTAETQSDKMALKIMSDLGYVVKIDGTNIDNMYMFKPYMDQIDFVNGSTMNKLIHSSISAIAATEDSDIKQQIFTRLGKDLFDSNASDAQKAMVLSSVLNSLTKNIGANGKALLDTDEAGLIFLSLQEQGVIKHNLTIKDTKNLTNVEAYKYMSELADVMLKLQKEKASTLDLADPMTMKVLKELEKQPKYKEAINKLLKLQEENPAAFQNGSMFNKQKFILSELDKKFNKLDIKNQSNESDMLPKLASYLSDGHDNVEDITKYLISNGYTKQEAMSFRDSKDFQDILKFAESFDKVYANAKTVTIDNGNDVYIDLEKFQGNVTTKFLNKILSEGKSSLRNINDVKQYSEYESDLYNELVARNSAVLQNGSLIHFDLSTDINEFKTFMKGYGYDISGNDASSIKKNLQDIKGLKNFRGDTLVLNIPRVNNIEDLKEALLQSSIDIGNQNISLRELNTIQFKDKQIQQADIDRAIMDQIAIKNIDPRIQVALKNAPMLSVVPFEQPVTGEKYNYTMPIASALFGKTENLRKLSGKAASLEGKDLEYILTRSAGAPVDYNTDLETYFILNQIVTKIADTKNHTISTIRVSQSESDFLKENNLVAYKAFGIKGYKNKDSIWRLTDDKLVLNKDFTTDELMDYVTSKDFNLRKLIPFSLTDVPEDDRGRQGIIDAFTTTSTEGLQESIPGLNRNTGLQLLNIRLPWDDGNNTRYAMFLKNLIDNKDIVYNPLKNADFVRNTKQNTEFKTFDEWYAHAENSKDPYDILAKLYVDSYNDMIHQNSNTDGSYDNWTILAATPRTRLILLEELEKGNTQASDELISKIKKVLPFKERQEYGVTGKTINVPGGYVGKAAEPDKAYVSEQRIGYAAGGPENYDIRADIEWVDLNTVQKAMDTLNEIRNNVDNEYARSFYSTYNIPMYKENNALKLLKGAVGNDGYIPIADADEVLRLFADIDVNDNGQFSGYTIKKDMTDVLKLMWGDNYGKACDEIFAQAKRFNTLKQQRGTTFAHGIVSGQAPSLEKSSLSGTYDYAPKDIGKESIDTSEIGHDNLDEFSTYINNTLKNKYLDGEDDFKYITDTSKDLLNNELIDKMTDKLMEDRNLYTSAPYTTDVEEYAYAHNFIGQMKSTIATYNELKQLFPGETEDHDQALMDTATTLVNLHRGVDYIGETTNFVIVKNGELINADKNYMESFGSANYEDLLFNIQEAKKDIKGATLLKINSQGIDNVAGLQMSYRKINTDSDYSDLITDLYRNFVIENAYYLGESGKVSVDDLEQQIFGGKINPGKIQEMLNHVPAENISQLQKYNRIYDTFRERSGALNLSKQEFMSMLKAVDTISNIDMSRNAIANSLGDEYERNKTVTQTIKNLVYAMGNPDSMPDEKRKVIKDFKDALNDFCLEEYKDKELTPQQQIEQLIFKNLVEKEDAATYDLLMRNRSLKEMKDEIESGDIKNGFAINKDNKRINRVNTQVLNNLKDAIEADDASLSDIKVIVSGDTETGLVDDALDSNTSIFNLGLKVRRANANGKYDTTTYNIFVNYEGEDLTPEERRQFRERWVQRNIMDAKDKRSIQFREENEGYKGTYEKYLDIDKYINTEGSEQTLYLRPSEIKQFINDLYGKEKGVFIGYNSSGADIPWMIKGGLVDNDFTNKVMHLDVKVLGDTSLAIYTSGKKDIRARDFGLNLMDAHEGLSDAKITEDLLLKTIDTTYNIVNIRSGKYKELEEAIKNSGLEISDGQLNEILTKVDKKLQDVRSTFTDLNTLFDIDKTITTDTVAAAKDIFEYMSNKRLCNMKYALYEKMIEDNYLSSKAIKALDENKQDIVNRLWSFASSKGKTKEEFAWAILNEVKLSGNDMNSLLETLGNEARISRIVERLQLNEKEFANYTDSKVFTTTNPKDDSEFNSEYFEALNKQRTTRQFLDTFKGITNSMRFSNDAEMRNFVNGLGKIYSFREGLDPQELLKDDIHLINTKITQQYKEYLYNHYGDTDAVMAQSKKGLYDLVDAVPVGVQINIGSKEKPNYITSDSSMIVLSKEQFRNLMGREYNPEEDTELYSQLLIHPADGNNKILPRKIVVDTELKGKYMKVPETLIETLGSRDFDGDHLTLLKPEDYSQEVLKIYTNNMYKIHDTQEKVLSFLRNKGVGYKNYKEENFIINGIGKDEEVLRLCREADEALENNNQNKLNTLTKDFEQYIQQKYPDYKFDDIKDALWVTSKDLYVDTGNIEPIKYINNPALYYSDVKRKVMLNGKEIEVGLTYSGEQRLKAETSQLTNKYLYNFIDQTTGVTQKYAINKLKNIEVNNPWTDLLASGIYGSDTVYKYFKNVGSLSDEDLTEFQHVLTDSLTESYKDSGYWTYINKGNRIEKQSKDIIDQIKAGNINAAFDSYDSLLRTTEEIQREHMKPGELMKALTSDQMQEHYKNLNDRIAKVQKNINLYNDLAKHSIYFPSDNDYGEATEFTLNSAINKLANQYSDQYNQDIWENGPKLNAFVITDYDDGGTPNGIGEDSILINNNVPKERKLVGYSRVVYNLNKDTKLSKDITEGKFYKGGTTLSIGGDTIKLAKDSYIAGISPKEIVVAQVDYLDNNFKMVTNIGGKGVVNSSYTTDGEFQILLNKPDLSKLPTSYSKHIAMTPQTITIKGPNGENIIAHGYAVPDVRAIVTEDTSSWVKSKDRKLDALHVVMDSNTINGVLDIGAKFEDGKLSGFAYGYPLDKQTYSKEEKPNPFYEYKGDGYLFKVYQDEKDPTNLTPTCIELVVLEGAKVLISAYCKQLVMGGFDEALQALREQAQKG